MSDVFVSCGNESNICSNSSSITIIVSLVIAPAVYLSLHSKLSRPENISSEITPL